METSFREGSSKRPIDPSKPFKGIIACCTGIPHEERIELADKIAELGGVHKYDLTPEVTHLFVNGYNTNKYRHVASERPDIKAMDAQWVEAVRELWKHDDEIDFDALEAQYTLKPLETSGERSTSQPNSPPTRGALQICLTNFGRQRNEIADTIVANGGKHTADFTRQCTHLIVNEPEGKKYAAAKTWNIYTVTLDWLLQSIERGMILDETKFDPLLPPDQQGKGAWTKRVASAKRSRSEASLVSEDGPRKLSKTASLKLRSQGQTIWGDILAKPAPKETLADSCSDDPSVSREAQQRPSEPVQQDRGIFGDCVFRIHGFNAPRTAVLEQTIASLGGLLSPSIDDAALRPAPREPFHRFLIVPQNSQPDTHPQTTHENLYIITEFYIEQCLHKKRFHHPNDHVLGRPFPRFPIPGFDSLRICKAVFTGIELSQVGRAVTQLGGRFQDELHKETSVMVCESLKGMREDKLKFALLWGIPIVSADWLWECISTGYNVPVEDFIYPELKKHYQAKDTRKPKGAMKHISNIFTDADAELPSTDQPKPPAGAGVDTTAFEATKQKPQPRPMAQQDSTISAEFFTPPTHRVNSAPSHLDKPATSEVMSPPKPIFTRETTVPKRTESEPFPKSAAVDAKQPDRLPSAPPTIHQDAESRGTEEKRKAEEDQKRAKDAERQALTSKITSLIHSTTEGAVVQEEDASKTVPRPRRRQILGRAISNVSNGSSIASVDASKSNIDTPRPAEIADSEDEDAQPPATQLGYSDPEAQEYKAALLSRMMGENGEIKSMGSTAPRRSISMGEISGPRVLRKR
ncbi:BRCT domain-containing protein [Stachybotrys elegans]|uniref:BRCT domain-containing protein n=1 Tax=Stachybotrys elegans TaxID=80388 RepID=A0A8K0SH16_9HYPO|nr:BRCT domain-containing protein [Stachybotrys elegans]